LILLEDGRPIFFLQERVGRGGKIFKTIKFRTMKHDPDKPHLDLDLANDPRKTRVGDFLRATAMDELPQLVNILKGDMSFVGPRALPLWIDDEKEGKKYKDITEIPGFIERAKVRPGLTGISQIYAPKDATREEKFKYDVEYIDKNGFWFDLKLIILSFWITFRGAWEKRTNKL
jgi:lipopolysaccharide/colanic/teichoic acid biosynthesis glycosyltransferase